MKKLRVGINGFGRIGRAITRINLEKNAFELVAINDINQDIQNLAYLLNYDSTYGRLKEQARNDGSELVLGNGKRMKVYNQDSILEVPWDNHGVDVVIDSSGIRANLDAIMALKKPNRKYLFTNAPTSELKTIIFGVNEDELDVEKDSLLSTSICDTIALSPLIKLVQESHEIRSGFLITLHPWLPYQNLLDGPSVSWSQPGDIYSHYALGRASTQNVIPKSTSAILAANHVFPGLSDRIESFSYRIPTQIVSSATLVLYLNKEIRKDDLVNRFERFERDQSVKVLRNSMEPLTSVDYQGEECSVVVDHRWTKVMDGSHLKLVYWYDNEWGYSNRVCDLLEHLSRGA